MLNCFLLVGQGVLLAGLLPLPLKCSTANVEYFPLVLGGEMSSLLPLVLGGSDSAVDFNKGVTLLRTAL